MLLFGTTPLRSTYSLVCFSRAASLGLLLQSLTGASCLLLAQALTAGMAMMSWLSHYVAGGIADSNAKV